MLPRRVTLNNHSRELQLKINHHTYATDSYVSRFNTNISKECKFCNVENNITHWFLECKKLKDFWTLVKKWILNVFEYSLFDNDVTKLLFGTTDDEHLEIYFCILIAKLYIHNNRNRQRQREDLYFSFTAYLCELKENLYLERHILTNRNQSELFYSKFHTLIENI